MNEAQTFTCAKCGQPVSSKEVVRIGRPISSGNPYPEDHLVCEKAECIEAAETWAEDELESLLDDDEDF